MGLGVPLYLRVFRLQGCTRGGLQGLRVEELREDGAEDTRLRAGWGRVQVSQDSVS